MKNYLEHVSHVHHKVRVVTRSIVNHLGKAIFIAETNLEALSFNAQFHALSGIKHVSAVVTIEEVYFVFLA